METKRRTQTYFIRVLVWLLIFCVSVGWQLIPLKPSKYIKPAHAADPDMVIFIEIGTPLSAAWTIVSDGSGEPFYNRYVRAAETYGTTGGAATHTHTLTFVDSGTSSDTSNNFDKGGSGTTIAARAHTHSALSGQSITTNNNLPLYNNLSVARYTTGGIPSSLPTGAILMFETTAVSGNWELYTTQQSRYIRGSSSGGTSGNNTPTHTVASGLNGGSGSLVAGSAATARATVTHTHSAGPGVASDGPSIEPPYYELSLWRATNSITSFPNGMIAGFTSTAFDSANWAAVSDIGDKYNRRFIKGDNQNALTSGGTQTHSHAAVDVTTGQAVGSANYDVSPANGAGSTTTHTHSGVTINLQADVDHTPEYGTLVLAQYTQPDTLDVTAPPSVTLNTGDPGTTTADYTFTAGELVTVSDGTTSAWSLTVSSTDLTAGANTIPNDNIYLKTDGTRTTEPTLISPDDSNVTESNYPSGTGLGTAQGIATGNTSADGDYNVRPTFFVVIPPYVPATDYSGTFTFTVL